MKKFLSVLLAVVMTFSLSSIAFAAEDTSNSIPEDATRHTIELNLAPGENSIEVGTNENGVAPCVWGDPSMSIIDNHSAYTSSFYLTDKYFAYEMEALTMDGQAIQEVYTVAFEYTGAAILASMSGYANGNNYKNDWITIDLDGNYRFLVTNSTNSYLTVSLTYYSWN